MTSSKYNTQDKRRIARYNKILEISKKNTTVSELRKYLPCTHQMIRLDCIHLTETGHLKTELLQAGHYNQFTLHFKSLKNNYDETCYMSFNDKRKQIKEKVEINLPENALLLPHGRIIKERMVMSVKAKLGKHYISGSSMSGSTW